MEQNYPGYEVGGARELVTLAMLKYLNDGTVLFSSNPCTWGRCKKTFQQGEGGGKNWNINLGSNEKNASGGVSELVVGYYPASIAIAGCGLVSFFPALKKVLDP